MIAPAYTMTCRTAMNAEPSSPKMTATEQSVTTRARAEWIAFRWAITKTAETTAIAANV